MDSVTLVRCPQCQFCGLSAEILVDSEALAKYERGAFVQDAFPAMPPEQRELLISGTHPGCWDRYMRDED
jgi:hypothetical protein